MSLKIHGLLLSKSRDIPTLHQIISKNGCLTLERKVESDFFYHLSKTVAAQQLSKKAATSIWNKIEAESFKRNLDIFDFCTLQYTEDIKKCGLSKFKVKAILELRQNIYSGNISRSLFTSNDFVFITSEITKLWGFGTWSAEVIALFYFALPDIWSDFDAALQRGIKNISITDDISESKIKNIMSPYKSYLSLHIWKAIDTNIL